MICFKWFWSSVTKCKCVYNFEYVLLEVNDLDKCWTNKSYFHYVWVTNIYCVLFCTFDINASLFLFLNSKLSADKGYFSWTFGSSLVKVVKTNDQDLIWWKYKARSMRGPTGVNHSAHILAHLLQIIDTFLLQPIIYQIFLSIFIKLHLKSHRGFSWAWVSPL